jgi:hypothetical protein
MQIAHPLRASRGPYEDGTSEEANMMSIPKTCLAGCAAFVVAVLAAPDQAAARIQCHGNFQITKYGPIATPYCEEEQIAFVARSYGVRVTGAQVRNNPLTKVYLCQTIGYDSRLKGSCAGYGPDSYAPAR